MKATTEQHRLWNQYRDFGDVGKIAEEIGVSRITISGAINSGKGTERVIMGINKFYLEKKNRLKATITEQSKPTA